MRYVGPVVSELSWLNPHLLEVLIRAVGGVIMSLHVWIELKLIEDQPFTWTRWKFSLAFLVTMPREILVCSSFLIPLLSSLLDFYEYKF